MSDNQIVSKYLQHQDLTWDLRRIAEEIITETGFVLDGGEAQRRTIYDPNKVWRIRLTGSYQGHLAVLRIENLKLERDEELIREAFRRQAKDTRVRPPKTYLTHPFDEKKGYAFSIDERVEGEVLFDPTGSPQEAVKKFSVFYRCLRLAVKEPFWPNAQGEAKVFSEKQAATWRKVAQEKNPESLQKVWPFAEHLREAMLSRLTDHPLRFQHAHLAGSDVRVLPDGSWVVFANHLWSWRQPGYDVIFPLWHQWMSLPIDRRTPKAVEDITETWMRMISGDLGDLVDIRDVRPMLFNRLYGSLLLDISAKIHRQGETPESVQKLEEIFHTEAERLMGDG